MYKNNPFGFEVKQESIEISGHSKSDHPAKLKPFEYFVIHCDNVNTDTNFYNGKRSDILIKLPIKKFDFGETLYYYPGPSRGKFCNDRISKFRLWITDEYDREINLNDGSVQFEIIFIN